MDKRFSYNEEKTEDGAIQIELSQAPASKNGTTHCRKQRTYFLKGKKSQRNQIEGK